MNMYSLPKLALVSLDCLLALSIGLVGMVKGNLKLIDVGLQLLLDAKSLSLGTGLSLKGSLHGVHSTLVVLPMRLKKRMNIKIDWTN